MLEIKNLSIKFKKEIFNDCEMNFKDNGFYCISGKSGCGKTTLFKIIVGEVQPQSIYMRYNNEEIDQDQFLFNEVSYIDQDGSFLNNMTIENHYEFYGKTHGIDYNSENVKEALKKVNLDDIDIKKYPSMLSTGERKRFLIALSLYLNKKIIFMDEPSSSLDQKNSKQLLELLKRLSQDHLIICATHNAIYKEACDVLYNINNCKVELEREDEIIPNKRDKEEYTLKRIRYSKFKNLTQKIYMCVLVILGIISTSIISLLIYQQMGYRIVEDNHTNDEGVLFWKQVDVSFTDYNHSDANFLNDQDYELIKSIPGVKEIIPYYSIVSPIGDDQSFTYTCQGTTKKYYMNSLEQYSYGDIPIQIVTYDDKQNITIDGKKIEGIYINHIFKEIMGNSHVEKGMMSFDISFPIKLYQETKTQGNYDYTLSFEGITEIMQSVTMNLEINGILDSKYYNDPGFDDLTGTIYMPYSTFLNYLKEYNGNYKENPNLVRYYRIISEDNNLTKIELEKKNELYRVIIPSQSIQTENNEGTILVYLLIIFSIVITSALLCLEVITRKKEIRLLKREGYKNSISKYYLKDLWSLLFIYVISSMIICVGAKQVFLLNTSDMLYFTIWLSSTLCVCFIYYTSFYLTLKRIMKGL